MTPAHASGGPAPLLHWHRQLETGLEPIDTQHRQLVDALGLLARSLPAPAPDPGVDEALASLARDLIRHCQTEETLMREAEFPERIAHANLHQELLHQVRDLQYRHAKGQALSLEALAGIADWLDRHIREADVAMAGYLKHLHAV